MTFHHRYLLPSLVIGLSALSFQPAAAATTACVVGVSPGNELNLRAGPGKRFQVIDGIDADTCGVVVYPNCGQGWCRVSVGDTSGWASEGFLRRGADPAVVADLEYVPLGSRTVSFATDRDVIQLGARAGRFRAIQLLVEQNDIFVNEARVTYRNGRAESLPIREEIKSGRRSRVLDLAGRSRRLERVELIYRSDGSGNRRARIELLGIAYRPNADTLVRRKNRQPEIRIDRAATLKWEVLGTQSVQFDIDRDKVTVGRREGQYRAIQLFVRKSDIEFDDLKIVYGNGRVEDVPIRSIIRAGRSSRVIDLRGENRFLREIRFTYKRRTDGYQRAIVDVYGLSVDAGYDGAALRGSLSTTTTGTTKGYTEVGILNCEISGGLGFIIGSSKDLSCLFNRPGRDERYFGSIDKFGLDLGATTQGVMSWAVLAQTIDVPPGALSGNFIGATGQVTVGAGVGANALVGGSQRSVVLQPLSVQAQLGLNLAIGVAELSLRR